MDAGRSTTTSTFTIVYNDEITSCWKIRIVKFAGSAPKSLTRSVFQALKSHQALTLREIWANFDTLKGV